MKHLVLALLAGTIALTPLMGVAQGQDRKAQFQEMANMDPGIIKVNRDKSGNVASLLILGKGQVSRALSKQKAKQYASKEAARSARTEFSKYLNTQVSWQEDASGTIVLKENGSAAGDEGENGSNQAGAATDVTTEQSKQYSSAALSGLRQVWAGYDEDGMRAVIFGWTLKDCAGIARASKAMGKTARTSVNEAKALEGAHRQDPDAAYQKAEGSSSGAAASSNSDASSNSNANANSNYSAGYGPNGTPTRTSAASADADDFF